MAPELTPKSTMAELPPEMAPDGVLCTGEPQGHSLSHPGHGTSLQHELISPQLLVFSAGHSLLVTPKVTEILGQGVLQNLFVFQGVL